VSTDTHGESPSIRRESAKAATMSATTTESARPFALLKFPETKVTTAAPVAPRDEIAPRLQQMIPRLQALADKNANPANWFIQFMDRFLTSWGV
jgi:hypothetical protein